ncbi:hypothetical protein NHX12_031075 [Muraenolepis orangiensis]|uniref:C2H2-type domain-containing protein n=1 Tax=Muraenolepis orangiensis TaxID=630683 RepID=A0A9Q0ED28_9TELE|nr:hypothetical protein NHX12_031075 [Muraenolepis orangiensis]
MPRSFLVKKYFAKQKPNYSELECYNEISLERYPLAELAPGDNMATTTCFTASLVWDLSVLPALYLPTSPLEPSPATGPLDLSSPSSLSSSAMVAAAASPTATRPAFLCKHCPKEYTSLGALKMHIRSHTLPCVCTTCGKAFSRPWLLRGHIRTHTGERPFSCPHCNRAFADRSNLRAHLQTHAEVKKYQCRVCSRTFSRMSLLQKHSSSGCCSSSTTG